MAEHHCTKHKHTHPQLPCPWPNCLRGSDASRVVTHKRGMDDVDVDLAVIVDDDGVTETVVEVPTFETRLFRRRQWSHDRCFLYGWAWVEEGAPLPSIGVCPVHDVGTVTEKPSPASRSGVESAADQDEYEREKRNDPMMADLIVGLCALAEVLRSASAPMSRTDVERAVARILLSRRENLREIPWDDVIRRAIIEYVLTVAADMWSAGPDIGDVPALKDG